MKMLVKLFYFHSFNLVIQVTWAFTCADGTLNTDCNNCTSSVCVCPSSIRNGMPCSQASDVNYFLIVI